MMRTKIPELVTIDEVERAVGVPSQCWLGKNFVAKTVVEKGLVRGSLELGHWIGPISSDSYYQRKRAIGFCHHSWVRLRNGRVFDPMRWVFEGTPPYIFVGPKSPRWPYAHCSEWVRKNPPPPQTEDRTLHFLFLKGASWDLVESLFLGSTFPIATHPYVIPVTSDQAHWLASLPLELLLGHAREVHEALNKAGFGHLIK